MSFLVALAGATLLVGCGARSGGGGGGGLTYLPPAELPPPDRAVFVPAPPDVVLDRLAERLPAAGLTVDRVEPERGLVVARYSGDPARYVDCGWIVPQGNGGGGPNGRRERLGAQQEAAFERSFNGEEAVFERGLRLDGRVVATVTPTAQGSLVDATANYVLTKSIEVVGRGGDVLARNAEIESFSTGGDAEFDAGTVCQPTGRLEAVVLEELTSTVVDAGDAGGAPPPPALAARVREVLGAFACPDVELTFAEGNALLVSGYVPDAFSQAEIPRQLQGIEGIGPVEARLGLHGSEFCQAIEIAAPLRDGDGLAGTGRLNVRAATPGGAGVLPEGTPLALDITLPAPDAHLIIDRIEPNGRVTHLAAGPAAQLGLWPGETSFRYDTGAGPEPPFGREMILAVATDRPLFEAPRPAGVEAADTYLPELRRRVEALRARGAPVEATYTVVRTQGRGPS